MSEATSSHNDGSATVRVTLVYPDGQRRTVDLTEQEYRRLVRQQRFSSPLESLFDGRSSLFDEFFVDEPLATMSDSTHTREPSGADGHPIPIRTGRRRNRAAEVQERLSQHAKELLQQAANTAQQWGRREVDTEHLLHALTGSDLVRTVLEQFKLSIEELRRQLETEAPRNQAGKVGQLLAQPRHRAVQLVAVPAARRPRSDRHPATSRSRDRTRRPSADEVLAGRLDAEEHARLAIGAASLWHCVSKHKPFLSVQLPILGTAIKPNFRPPAN